MAQDVKIDKGIDDVYDIPVENGDFVLVDGVETAIGVSLFTDARTDAANVSEAFKRRGFSGNLLTLAEGFELGGELWTLEQARLDQNTLNAAQDIVKRALQYMINDGIADTIDVVMTKTSERAGTIEITLFKGLDEVGRYITLWTSTQPI